MTRSSLIPDLSHRAMSLELMDDLTSDARPLFTTLRDFAHINRFVSQTRRVLRETVLADVRRRDARDVSLLDIGAGGCDTGLWFARTCRSRGIDCAIYCLDNDPRVLTFARDACSHEPSISFIQADARDIPRLNLTVDYAFTNHFFHHLSDRDIPDLLRAMRACSRYGFVVSDLHRHVAWYLGFTFLGKVLWRKGFTLADGRMSIRRGFKRDELKGYLTRASIDANISRGGWGHWRITTIPPRRAPLPAAGDAEPIHS